MPTIYVNLRFLTQRITGVQRFAFEICKALDALLASQGDFKVIGLLPKREIMCQYADYNFRQLEIRPCGRFSGHLWEQLDLPWYSRGAPLINLCNSAPLFKFKQYLTIHDVIFLTSFDSQKIWFKLWYRLIARVTKISAKKIFTVSEFSKQEICQRLAVNPHKVIVLGNAANMVQYGYDDSILSKLGLESQDYFFMIGSNSLRKNTALVSQLFAEDPEFAGIKLVIAGGEFSNLGGVVEQLVSNNIIKTGYVSDEQLRSLYAAARALIFPSTYEGFGIPVLEAMAENTPVICSDIAVMHEVAGEAALYFHPQDKAALAHQLKRVLSDAELRNELLTAAHSRLLQFSWQRFALLLFTTIQNGEKVN